MARNDSSTSPKASCNGSSAATPGPTGDRRASRPSGLTPAAVRPTTACQKESVPARRRGNVSAGAIIIGTHISARPDSPSNPSGATPITSKDTPLMVMVCPITVGSPP